MKKAMRPPALYDWSVAFSLSVVGTLITLVNFVLCRGYVKDYGSAPGFEALNGSRLLAVIAGILLLIPVSTWLLHHQDIARMALSVMTFGILLVFAHATRLWTARSRILSC